MSGSSPVHPDSEARGAAPNPSVSVVITTCAMPQRAARAVASVLACVPAPLEVIVVENRPHRGNTARLLAERFIGDERVRCVDEPLQGLSHARNCGLRAARGEIVAFTDDDVVVDGGWIGAIANAFACHPHATCVTGRIAALALDSDEQRVFESFARLGKGSQRQVYAASHPPADDPLFPYAAGRFGSGANTALRADFARAIGGFDVHLGAGTRARGGEDLDLFIRVLRAGEELVYEPAALLRHEHVDSRQALRHHAFDYGVGLSAMLTKQLLAGERRRDFLRRIPAGARYMLARDSAKNANKGTGYPRTLDVLELLGMAAGPGAYLASVLAGART
jgi:GT2 family glycosyltransferase